MSRSKTLPRFIRPDSIEEGDTIRVAWVRDDVEYSRTGTVDRVIEDGRYRIATSQKGARILEWEVPNDKQVKVTLLAVKSENTDTPLFTI